MSNKGISIILCCYNSASRLGPTLQHLSRSILPVHLPCQVIIVDNASTDLTSHFAIEKWKQLQAPFPLKLVYETQPGLIYARKKGIESADYDYLLFCDDDNWLSPLYIKGMYECLESDTQIAACGGRGIAVFEQQEPDWFSKFQEAYATGSQQINQENDTLLNLYGAGMAMRKSCLEVLSRAGFNSMLKGRTGNSLSSAEDTELSYALVLAGYKLVYLDQYAFQHYLPEGRLNRAYLTKLYSSFGTDGPIRNLYYAYITQRKSHQWVKHWPIHFLLSVYRSAKYWITPPKEHEQALYWTWNKHYMQSLIRLRPQYKAMKMNIQKIQGYTTHQHTTSL